MREDPSQAPHLPAATVPPRAALCIASLTNEGPDMPRSQGARTVSAWGPDGSSTELTMETPPYLGEEAPEPQRSQAEPPTFSVLPVGSVLSP